MRVCHGCLMDVPREESVSVHVHFARLDTPGHPHDEDYYYHVDCYEQYVRLHA